MNNANWPIIRKSSLDGLTPEGNVARDKREEDWEMKFLVFGQFPKKLFSVVKDRRTDVSLWGCGHLIKIHVVEANYVFGWSIICIYIYINIVHILGNLEVIMHLKYNSSCPFGRVPPGTCTV